MAATRYSTNDMRRQIGSPRSKNRDNGDIPCRNITIYGHCKYREAGCSFKHDQNKISAPQPDFSSKKPFNVESPSFTPASTTQQQGTSKKSTLPSQAANAPPFTPRGLNKLPAPSIQKNTESSILTATSRDFTPSAYDMAIAANGGTQESTATAAGGGGSMYVSDPFASRLNTGVATPSHYHNPYAADQSAVYVQPPGSLPAGVAPPPNYHFYQPLESFKGSLQPWERTPNDFFMPQAVREDYHKKMYATQIVLNTLPSIKEWHSLYPLDVSGKKNPASFGCPSWIYKAYNSKVGRYFALRRLEGFGLSSTAPMERARAWYKIRNTNIVSLFDAFTTGNFGDSSLIFVYDYHPLSKTLQECHFPSGRYRSAQVEEDVLWSYICQISNALRAIHHNNLAARSIEMTKIIVDGNRIRLAACGVLDVTSYGTDHRSIQELQQEDFLKFGTVIFALASGGMVAMPSDARKARELMNPKLSDKLKDAVVWLISSPAHGSQDSKTIDRFLALIAVQMTAHCDRIGQESDYKGEMLAKELENGRIARLMLKLNAINERGDLGNIKDWSETGDRFHLKLFRDYAFHRVDAEGRPDLGIGHMLSCMSKLDTGVDEQIQLISRDNQTVYVISYRQLRQSLNRAFNELLKLSKDGAPGSNPPNLYPPYQMPS